jgi:hypothetical protein
MPLFLTRARSLPVTSRSAVEEHVDQRRSASNCSACSACSQSAMTSILLFGISGRTPARIDSTVNVNSLFSCVDSGPSVRCGLMGSARRLDGRTGAPGLVDGCAGEIAVRTPGTAVEHQHGSPTGKGVSAPDPAQRRCPSALPCRGGDRSSCPEPPPTARCRA